MSLPASGSLAIGRVLRPWGRLGAVVVAPLTHDVERFRRLRSVEVAAPEGARSYAVTEVRIDRHGRPVVTLEGVDSISAAQALRGAALRVPEGEAERPPGDAYFNHELVGTEVRTGAGEALGQVVEILETGATNLLVVRRGATEVLIPAAREFLVQVDVAARRIVVNPIPGLLELNPVEDGRAV